MNFLVLIEIAGFPRACHIYIYINGQTRLHYPARLRARVKMPNNNNNNNTVLLHLLWLDLFASCHSPIIDLFSSSA